MDSGKESEWNLKHQEAITAHHETETNLNSEIRMYNILQKRLNDGDYSTSSTSAITKRRFGDSSMANDGFSTPTNTKRSGR